jgi:hypothetical protein
MPTCSTARHLSAPKSASNGLWGDTATTIGGEPLHLIYGLNGHNHQRPGLTIYLPGNGGLLYAVALIAAGWDGAPARHAPGFPDDGQWNVRWEGLRAAP